MKFLPLVWRNLLRRKVRTIFTVLSIFIAFVLFGVLMAIRMAFNMIAFDLCQPGNAGTDHDDRREAGDERRHRPELTSTESEAAGSRPCQYCHTIQA